jgi:hypothetical protein
VPSITVPGPYPDAAAAVIDQVLLQVFYRQLSTVAVHFGINASHDAAVWLSQNGRGGSVDWKIPGRVFLWTDLIVAPGVPGSPTVDVWVLGGGLNYNSVFLRRGFWTLYLAPGTKPPGG